jgi:protein-S-isoprenylcysteine O-methyltransferase Ste14
MLAALGVLHWGRAPIPTSYRPYRAYAVVRHPSYSAGILMNLGLGLALGSWGSAAVLTLASVAVYSYRIAIEERALLAVVGEPYREYMRTRRRLIPFVY